MQENIILQKDNTANPAPLGLCGFGLTTVLLNIHNAGFYPIDSTIMSMGIMYGGLAQVLVGLMEWKKNNTFGTTAFTSYGLFWISLVAVWLLPKAGLTEAPAPFSLGCYLGMWGIFSTFLFICTLKLNRALQVVFFTVVLLFFGLSLSNFFESHTIHVISGYIGIFCGFSAIYTGLAQVVNEIYKREIMPLGSKK